MGSAVVLKRIVRTIFTEVSQSGYVNALQPSQRNPRIIPKPNSVLDYSEILTG